MCWRCEYALFQWKNLRCPDHVARALAALPVRFAFDWLRAPLAPRGSRFAFTRAFFAALNRLGACRRTTCPPRRSLRAERDFFKRFAADRMAERAIDSNLRLPAAPPVSDSHCIAGDRDELLAAAGGPHG